MSIIQVFAVVILNKSDCVKKVTRIVKLTYVLNQLDRNLNMRDCMKFFPEL